MALLDLLDYPRNVDTAIVEHLHELKTHDNTTYKHSIRTAGLFVGFCHYSGLKELLSPSIVNAVLLHDIGKLKVPPNILCKETPLNEREWEIIRMHPIYGVELLNPLPDLNVDEDIILYHHRNMDGSGYPHYKKKKPLPDGVKVLRMIDSFEAMTSRRPYGVTFSVEEATGELMKLANVYYDRSYVSSFISFVKMKNNPSSHFIHCKE